MWQTLGLNQTGKKAGVNNEPLMMREKLRWISQAHVHVRNPYVYLPERESEYAPWRWHENDGSVVPYTAFLCLMSLGLITTTALGVVMAFRFGPSVKIVATCLAFGIACPMILFYLKM